MILKNKIKKIIDAIKNTEINEIEISSFWGAQRIKMKKNMNNSFDVSTSNQQQVEQHDLIKQTNNDTNVGIVSNQIKDKTSDDNSDMPRDSLEKLDNSTVVRAPLVGTFYISQKPGDPPFVEVGGKVKIGDTLCIIEAMKIFNEIESEHTGIIKEILVNNSDPVEFDQPLFKIEEV